MDSPILFQLSAQFDTIIYVPIQSISVSEVRLDRQIDNQSDQAIFSSIHFGQRDTCNHKTKKSEYRRHLQWHGVRTHMVSAFFVTDCACAVFISFMSGLGDKIKYQNNLVLGKWYPYNQIKEKNPIYIQITHMSTPNYYYKTFFIETLHKQYAGSP